ncbi:MAG TPA: hypothetical protein PKW49_04215 [Paludibacteraceae bacterium]|nr:hypothetical protein [Paludibacteraceae bacterium]
MEEIQGQASVAQVELWKKQYGEIVEARANGHVAYFKKPSKAQVSYAMSLQQQNKILEMLETVLKGCYVSGSRVFIDDVDYILGCAGIVDLLVSAKQVELKNL